MNIQRICASLAIAASCLGTQLADAQSAIALSGDSQDLNLAQGSSRLLRAAADVSRVSIADPAVADVQMMGRRDIYLLARKSGTTNLMVWTRDGHLEIVNLVINLDATVLRKTLAKVLRDGSAVQVSALGDNLVLAGKLGDATQVQQAMLLSEKFSGGKVINLLQTTEPAQVMLEVKVAEVEKTLADSLGLQFQGPNFSLNTLNGASALGFAASAAFKSGNSNTWLQANIQNGLVHMLAEPNIMAISGQEGQFLSGGTIFLPVPQSGTSGSTITLQPQNFGISVKFVPTVLEAGRINLAVQSEVSSVNPAGVTVSAGNSSMLLPALSVRRASTTVQLADGQSFAIGGLVNHVTSETLNGVPGLADVPILGALFRSSSFQKNNSELLVVVTPHLVKPLDVPPALPTDKVTPATSQQMLINGKMEGDAR